jgi:hypothetical protein
MLRRSGPNPEISLRGTIVNPRFGRRQWVKLWVNEWLEGTTRYEMSDAQRALWVDLMAMAGRSRFPGVICAGEVEGKLIGYPLSKYQALPSGPLDIEATFSLFVQRGKITLEVNHDGPVPLYLIRISNWDRFQSEYQRTKGYQKSYREKRATKTNTASYQETNSQTNSETIGTEGEEEGEEKHCANANGSHAGDDLRSALDRIWRYYIAKLAKNPTLLSLTSARKNKGMARLRECLAKADGDIHKAEALMKLAVDALASSDFHRGANDRKKAYDSWEKNLFANQEQLERWLEQGQ